MSLQQCHYRYTLYDFLETVLSLQGCFVYQNEYWTYLCLIYIHDFIYYSAVQSHCKCTQKRYNKQNKIEEPQSRGKQPIDIKSVCSCKWNKACIICKCNTLDLIPAINQLQYNLDHQVDQSRFLGLDVIYYKTALYLYQLSMKYRNSVIRIFLARYNISLYHSFWKFIPRKVNLYSQFRYI